MARSNLLSGFGDAMAGLLLACAGLAGLFAQVPWLWLLLVDPATAYLPMVALRAQAMGFAYVLVSVVGVGWSGGAMHVFWRACSVTVVALQVTAASITAAVGPTPLGSIAYQALLVLLAVRAWRTGLRWTPAGVVVVAAVCAGVDWSGGFWLRAVLHLGEWGSLVLLGLALRRAE